MPEPQPGTRIVLLLAERLGLAGSIAGYNAVCHVFVNNRNGADMMLWAVESYIFGRCECRTVVENEPKTKMV